EIPLRRRGGRTQDTCRCRPGEIEDPGGSVEARATVSRRGRKPGRSRLCASTVQRPAVLRVRAHDGGLAPPLTERQHGGVAGQLGTVWAALQQRLLQPLRRFSACTSSIEEGVNV